MNTRQRIEQTTIETLIANETKRLSDKYGKAFLDCDELVELTGLGRDNVRTMMRSDGFPVMRVGNRQVVSILGFVTWQMKSMLGDNHG